MSQGLRPRSSGADDRRPPRRYRDLECVQLRADLPGHGLKTGEVGTIVHVFDTADAYLVEFVNDDGSTRALAELTPRQIAPA
jgi:hypothetical protein